MTAAGGHPRIQPNCQATKAVDSLLGNCSCFLSSFDLLEDTTLILVFTADPVGLCEVALFSRMNGFIGDCVCVWLRLAVS